MGNLNMFKERNPQACLTKAHIPPETGLRWLQNAKEINTQNMKCTCPTPTPDARYFAFWWNIGLRVLMLAVTQGGVVWNLMLHRHAY